MTALALLVAFAIGLACRERIARRRSERDLGARLANALSDHASERREHRKTADALVRAQGDVRAVEFRRASACPVCRELRVPGRVDVRLLSN